MFFRAGHEEDWVDKSGNYATKFLCDLHQNVSTLKDISMDTKVILVTVWSDGFEAHWIKAKNEFNSLQIFTLTILPQNIKIPTITQFPLQCASRGKTIMISSSAPGVNHLL
jgi:hypothetical protein